MFQSIGHEVLYRINLDDLDFFYFKNFDFDCDLLVNTVCNAYNNNMYMIANKL